MFHYRVLGVTLTQGHLAFWVVQSGIFCGVCGAIHSDVQLLEDSFFKSHLFYFQSKNRRHENKAKEGTYVKLMLTTILQSLWRIQMYSLVTVIDGLLQSCKNKPICYKLLLLCVVLASDVMSWGFPGFPLCSIYWKIPLVCLCVCVCVCVSTPPAGVHRVGLEQENREESVGGRRERDSSLT